MKQLTVWRAMRKSGEPLTTEYIAAAAHIANKAMPQLMFALRVKGAVEKVGRGVWKATDIEPVDNRPKRRELAAQKPRQRKIRDRQDPKELKAFSTLRSQLRYSSPVLAYWSESLSRCVFRTTGLVKQKKRIPGDSLIIGCYSRPVKSEQFYNDLRFTMAEVNKYQKRL